MKSLVAFKQTLSQRRTSIGGSGSLVFTGDLVDLGAFESFISYGEKSRKMTIGVDLKATRKRNPLESLSSTFQFSTQDEPEEHLRVPHRTPETPSVLSNAKFAAVSKSEDIRLEMSRIDEGLYELDTSLNLMDYPEYKLDGAKPRAILSGMFPEYFVTEIGNVPVPMNIRVIGNYFESTIGRLNYLKPLRAPAKRFYLADPGTQLTVDSTGAYLPQLLYEYSGKEIFNCGPDSLESPAYQDFDWALSSWLHYLKTGDRHSSSNATNEVYATKFKDVVIQVLMRSFDDYSFSIADSGFGYSQVLPILTTGLVTERGGTLIVEQPELHLNPALQVRLAEFFVGMLRCGKQVIIETHSEHIVNAIRTLVAEADDALEQKCKIHFFTAEKDEGPRCEELAISEDGTIANWPKEFFGEAMMLSGRLLRAQRKRLST